MLYLMIMMMMMMMMIMMMMMMIMMIISVSSRFGVFFFFCVFTLVRKHWFRKHSLLLLREKCIVVNVPTAISAKVDILRITTFVLKA